VILEDFTGYVHSQLLDTFENLGVAKRERYLIDAYCGSGLFSVTCSEGFESVIGVEISFDSVKYAIRNAKANNIANASFLTGTADKIFEVVKTPPHQTAVIIDPPRKVPTEHIGVLTNCRDAIKLSWISLSNLTRG
jgi:tRNA (uracil-5-)-methyltransferase